MTTGVPSREIRGGFAVMEPDGSRERVLVRGFLSQPQWSPDGSQIFFYADGAVQVIDVAEGREGTVIDGIDPQGLSFALSPDGGRIIYTQPVSPDQGEELWIAGVDGSDPHMIAEGLHGREPSPTWSPDSTAIAFVRDGNIWTIDLQTGEQSPVTDNSEHETLPLWGAA